MPGIPLPPLPGGGGDDTELTWGCGLSVNMGILYFSQGSLIT